MKYLYESAILGTPRDVPKGYSRVENVSVLRGPNFCISTACAPLVTWKLPDFLRGACDPHPANSEKRHMLYKKFWRCLAPWEYAWEDKRDIMPDV